MEENKRLRFENEQLRAIRGDWEEWYERSPLSLQQDEKIAQALEAEGSPAYALGPSPTYQPVEREVTTWPKIKEEKTAAAKKAAPKEFPQVVACGEGPVVQSPTPEGPQLKPQPAERLVSQETKHQEPAIKTAVMEQPISSPVPPKTRQAVDKPTEAAETSSESTEKGEVETLIRKSVKRKRPARGCLLCYSSGKEVVTFPCQHRVCSRHSCMQRAISSPTITIQTVNHKTCITVKVADGKLKALTSSSKCPFCCSQAYSGPWNQKMARTLVMAVPVTSEKYGQELDETIEQTAGKWHTIEV